MPISDGVQANAGPLSRRTHHRPRTRRYRGRGLHRLLFRQVPCPQFSADAFRCDEDSRCGPTGSREYGVEDSVASWRQSGRGRDLDAPSRIVGNGRGGDEDDRSAQQHRRPYRTDIVDESVRVLVAQVESDRPEKLPAQKMCPILFQCKRFQLGEQNGQVRIVTGILGRLYLVDIACVAVPAPRLLPATRGCRRVLGSAGPFGNDCAADA